MLLKPLPLHAFKVSKLDISLRVRFPFIDVEAVESLQFLTYFTKQYQESSGDDGTLYFHAT